MSKYGFKYQMQWLDMESSVTTTVDIIDTDIVVDDLFETVIISLRPAGTPLVISVINNNRDKYEPIRAKQAVIRFLSDRNLFQDITTFSDSADDRWMVHIYTNTPTDIFKGFLMLTDMEQLFQPDPVECVLTASDHLGLLSDIPLVDDSGINPFSKYRIAEIIALCLKKTGLELDIKVINNLRHGSGQLTNDAVFSSSGNYFVTSSLLTDFFYVGMTIVIAGTASNNWTSVVTEVDNSGVITQVRLADTITVGESVSDVVFTDQSSTLHFYDGIYVDAKTFEDEVGKCVNCREVLEIILGEDCYLTQWKGAWYIMRIDEFDTNDIYIANFDSDGLFLSQDAGTTIAMNIGSGENKFFCNADQLQGSDRPHKLIKTTFNYQTPIEIIENIDFERGDFIEDLPSVTIDGVVYSAKKYQLDGWGFSKFRNAGQSSLPATTEGYVKRLFNNLGYEQQRYVVIENISVSDLDPENSLRSTDIVVQKSDIISISFDVKFENQFTPTGAGSETIPGGGLQLTADDGSFYIYLSNSNAWLEVTPASPFDTVRSLFCIPGTTEATTQWTTISATTLPMPKSGVLNFFLIGWPREDAGDIYFSNLSMEYVPLINGTYRKYVSQTNQVELADPAGYNTTREKEVFLSDSPKPLFKGSMFFPRISSELYSGSIQFAAPSTVSIPGGDFTADFRPGMYIYITSAGQTGMARISTSDYNTIPDQTDLVITGLTVTNVTESGTIRVIAFQLTQWFYTASTFAMGYPTDTTFLHPYAYIQAFSIWNQYNKAYRIFTGSVKNLGALWPDLLHKYSLTDANPNTNDRFFMLISFSQDWKLGIWTAVFLEVFNTDTGKIYSDTFTFKYIQ